MGRRASATIDIHASMAGGKAAKTLKEGYLEKNGSLRWQTRFFVLQGHYLRYYSDARSKGVPEKRKGVLDMDGITKVSSKSGSGKAFQLDGPGGVSVLLRAPDEAQAEEWLAAIRKVVEV